MCMYVSSSFFLSLFIKLIILKVSVDALEHMCHGMAVKAPPSVMASRVASRPPGLHGEHLTDSD